MVTVVVAIVGRFEVGIKDGHVGVLSSAGRFEHVRNEVEILEYCQQT